MTDEFTVEEALEIAANVSRTLVVEVKRLQADAARLAWLDNHADDLQRAYDGDWYCRIPGKQTRYYKTLRALIEAEMARGEIR